MSALENNLSSGASLPTTDASVSNIARDLTTISKDVKSIIGDVPDSTPGKFRSAVAHVANFIKNNWDRLLAFTAAWVVILSFTSVMYGFHTTTVPLATGLGCGFGVGMISAIVTVTKIDPKNEHAGRNTFWGLINSTANRLDMGTKTMVTSVTVTVVLAAAVVFPYVIGGLVGAIVANHLVTKIGYGKNLGPDTPPTIEQLQAQVSDQQKKLAEMAEGLNRLNEQLKRAKT